MPAINKITWRCVCVTFFPSADDGFGALGLDGGTGGSEEAGALRWRTTLLADWLQKDFILAGK